MRILMNLKANQVNGFIPIGLEGVVLLVVVLIKLRDKRNSFFEEIKVKEEGFSIKMTKLFLFLYM